MAMDTPKTDPLNHCVVRIVPMFDEIILSQATGFFYSGTVDNKPSLWLLTNWHVVTGRNASKPSHVLHKSLALPNRLKVAVPKTKNTDGNEIPGQLFMYEYVIDLYNRDGKAQWTQSKEKNAIDIAVLHVGDFFADSLVKGINELANVNDMAVEIGNEVFILGYPLGFSHFFNTPIWKKGCIASEPHLETPESRAK